MSVAAVILAGGAASRMGGGDKTLLTVGDRSMLARIIATLRADHADIAINANGEPARFADFALPVLSDGAFSGEGPLAGVLAGLDWAASRGATALLSVPGDTPFIPSGLARTLAPPPACAASADRTHHLVALWPLACRAALRDLLDRRGSRAVARFTEQIGMRRVDFPLVPWDSFLNINTRDDLETARRVAATGAEEKRP